MHLGDAVGIASDGTDVWVARDERTLSRIDGTTGAELATLQLADQPIFRRRDAGFLAVGADALWLTVPMLGNSVAPQELWRIDPANGRALQRLPIGPNPLPPVSGERFLWIVTAQSHDGRLLRVDTTTEAVVDVPVGDQPWGIAVGDGSVWVGHQSDRELWRLRPDTGGPLAKIPLDGAARGVGFGAGHVWVTTETGVVRVDPATNRVSRTFELIEHRRDQGPTVVVALAGSIWISVE